MLVAGADGCRRGWVVIVAACEPLLHLTSLRVVAGFEDVLYETRSCSAVAVDMPIGLSSYRRRAADTEARRLLAGRRGSSVFPSPVRPALAARTYAEACTLSRAVCGRALSRETYGLLAKIKDVDGLMQPGRQRRVRESHPEVAFAALNGGTSLATGKRTVLGAVQRRALLGRVWRRPEELAIAPRGTAGDDVLDAAVLAWSAMRIARGEAVSLPACAEADDRGLRMEIVY